MVRSLNRQKGVVIIVALFIMALVATMAYVMMARLDRDTRRISLISRNVQAENYAQGSVAWAMTVLENNYQHRKSTRLTDIMPLRSPVNTMPGGYQIKSVIYDMQARYNINNLSNENQQTAFANFLHVLQPNMNMEDVQNLVRAIADWVNKATRQETEFTKYYLEQNPPYRAAHRPLVSISELMLVKGMTPSLYGILEPYLTALPKATNMNINTMPMPLMLTLSDQMTMETAKALGEARNKKPFLTTEAFAANPIATDYKLDQNMIIVESEYFLVETTVAVDKQKVVLYTLLQRTAGEDDVKIIPIWQSKGVW